MSQQARFVLSWDSFQKNICNGLGSLQQNEDFVDMTIAADGHFVKVHQLVLSLASPYIKDLIKSAQCQNPVIFLNKISYTTLCYLLEYIYTGEVVVAKENIEELCEAAKSLDIKGLKNMEYQLTLSNTTTGLGNSTLNKSGLSGQTDTDVLNYSEYESIGEHLRDGDDDKLCELSDDNDDNHDTVKGSGKGYNTDAAVRTLAVTKSTGKAINSDVKPTEIQYSVSNQGNLQMILNRFIYYLRYSGKTGQRQWRCTDYIKKKCPASVVTKDNIVLRRTSAHIHPFHDKKIAKRVVNNAVFAVITEAERQGDYVKNQKNVDAEKK